MRANHPRFDVEMEAASTTATGTLIPWVCQKASNRYVWIDWIVKGNLPFAFVEMETTRRYTNLANVCEESRHGARHQGCGEKHRRRAAGMLRSYSRRLHVRQQALHDSVRLLQAQWCASLSPYLHGTSDQC
ncbi:hypothetical protein F443_09343, partial [Phytophthora nicotianae P1569]